MLIAANNTVVIHTLISKLSSGCFAFVGKTYCNELRKKCEIEFCRYSRIMRRGDSKGATMYVRVYIYPEQMCSWIIDMLRELADSWHWTPYTHTHIHTYRSAARDELYLIGSVQTLVLCHLLDVILLLVSKCKVARPFYKQCETECLYNYYFSPPN